MKQQLLLLEDVESLGRKGEVVNAKPGYVRNFLLPQGIAVVASPNTLRKQERLCVEREQQAIVDRKEADELAQKIEGSVLETRVKVDPEGHMYGSVSASDIALLFQEKGLPVEKKYILVTRPIKETGVHKISLKLKEGIPASCQLHIIPEGIAAVGLEAVVAPIVLDQASGAASESESAQ
ncbi:MAG: 50S ribosomal protein L9 [Chlamydiia bacterium]|nr:50S ribosomal protein L9 [Chlamydiia bacterium]